MTIAALREKRAAMMAECRALIDKKDRTADDDKRFQTLEGGVQKLDAEIRRQQWLDEAERHSESAETLTAGGHDKAELEQRYRIGKAIAEFAGTGKLTGPEAEWNAEHRSGRPGALAVPTSVFLGGEHRAVTTTAPGAGLGGNLVATQLGNTIDRLRPVLAVQGMGATVLTGLTANLDLPRVKASGTAGWVAEHTNATRSDAQFDKVSMGPNTVTAEYEVSRRMLLQAAQLEPILRADLGYLLAQALDKAAIVGGGSHEPTGIIAAAGVPVVSLGTNGAAMSIDTAADLIGKIADADATGNTGFLTNSKVRTAAMKLKDGDGTPFGIASVFKNERLAFSNQVPNNLTKGTGANLSAILYGVWSDLIIGYWSNIDIVINPYHSDVASKGGALMHAFLDADIALRHDESFAVAKDVITS